MTQSRLHSSQELVLHQVNVDQPFTPVGIGGREIPNSPLSSRKDAPSGSLYAPGTLLLQTPGGSSSTAPASIACPDVRHRPEWMTAIEDVELYSLPRQQLYSSAFSNERVIPIRYVADRYDRRWLSQRFNAQGVGATGATASLARGKAGSAGTVGHVPLDLTVTLLEDLITSFELCAHENPDVPLERLNTLDSSFISDTDAPAPLVDEVRQYWLRKRRALGGHVPCIPAIRMNVREDNQTALCHGDILGDCPLPFKYRDWSVSVIQRKKPRMEGPDCDIKAESNANALKEMNACSTAAGMMECEQLVRAASSLAGAMLRREKVRLHHTQLCLYELAVLRGIGGCVDDTRESPWVPVEAVAECWGQCLGASALKEGTEVAETRVTSVQAVDTLNPNAL